MTTHDEELLEKRIAELEERIAALEGSTERRLHRIETWVRLLTGAASVFTRSEL